MMLYNVGILKNSEFATSYLIDFINHILLAFQFIDECTFIIKLINMLMLIIFTGYLFQYESI